MRHLDMHKVNGTDKDTMTQLQTLGKPGPEYFKNMLDFTVNEHAKWRVGHNIDHNINCIIKRYDEEGWYELPNFLKEYLEQIEEYPEMYVVLEWKADTEGALEGLRQWTEYGRCLIEDLPATQPAILEVGDFADGLLQERFYQTMAAVLNYKYLVNPASECNGNERGWCPVCPKIGSEEE